MSVVSKLQEFGNSFVVIFSDGNRTVAKPTIGNLWLAGDDIKIKSMGNLYAITFASTGSTELAYPTVGNLWLVGGTGGGGSDWVWPLNHEVWNLADGYGMRYNPVTGEYTMHYGQDINGDGTGMSVNGEDIHAIQDGTVVARGTNPVGGFGYYIQLLHPDGTASLYGHMIALPPVNMGDSVAKSQVIGNVGSTGNSSGPHLHFETEDPYGATPMDPLVYMAERGLTWG